MLGFILTTLIFIFIFAGSSLLTNIQQVNADWEKYRCRPDVMMLAQVYGHNAMENINYCLKNGFDQRAQSVMSPFYGYMGSFVNVLVTLLSSINSIRMIFATIIGSVTQVFGEFSTRIQAVFYRFQTSAIKIKYLMGRVFATMYAVIFMGMSGIKATQNFGNTFLFQFLDTFCFDPDTLVNIKGKGQLPIKSVEIGDVFTSGERVTATFKFMADGQPMVKLGDIVVSTNHYLLHNGKWIQASSHPDAVPICDWAGGDERPLICLNTTTHSFPVGKYQFRDYDETEEGDLETMKTVLNVLNGGKTSKNPMMPDFTTACDKNTMIKLHDGKTTPAHTIKLGTQLSHGKVIGVIRKECQEVCVLGDTFTPGTAIWVSETNSWKRASQIITPKRLETPLTFVSFVVSPSACVETASGTVFRDYVEVHSPDTEAAYTHALMKECVSVLQTEC